MFYSVLRDELKEARPAEDKKMNKQEQKARVEFLQAEIEAEAYFKVDE